MVNFIRFRRIDDCSFRALSAGLIVMPGSMAIIVCHLLELADRALWTPLLWFLVVWAFLNAEKASQLPALLTPLQRRTMAVMVAILLLGQASGVLWAWPLHRWDMYCSATPKMSLVGYRVTRLSGHTADLPFAAISPNPSVRAFKSRLDSRVSKVFGSEAPLVKKEDEKLLEELESDLQRIAMLVNQLDPVDPIVEATVTWGAITRVETSSKYSFSWTPLFSVQVPAEDVQ